MVSGAIAQLGERLPCTQEVGGSIPPGSTKFNRSVASEHSFVASNFGVTLLFNNLDNKVFDVLKWVNTFMCLFISSVAFAQLLNICRLAQSINEQMIYAHKRNVVSLQVYPRMFWVIWSSD